MKVLVADDDPAMRRLLQHMIAQWGHETHCVEDGIIALDVLCGDAPPLLAVLDWTMPGLDGVEVCRRLRRARTEPYIYVIVLTARDNPEDLVRAIDAGADDFLGKPCNKQELRVRLRAGQRIVEMQESLRFKATHDPLTGVFNRGLLEETLARELARAQRAGVSTGILMIDLDHFKSINDTHGHPAGDVVLKETCRRIGSRLRAFDMLGRYGGEEFMVILPECGAQNATDVGERVRQIIRETPVETPAGPVSVTASIGVSVVPPNVPSANPFIELADKALYMAKQSGRDRVIIVAG